MLKYIAFLIFIAGCSDNKTIRTATKKTSSPEKDSVPVTSYKVAIQYDLLKQDFLKADSVLLLSHHSPNMPIQNMKTGKYYEKTIPFIEHGTINYETSVQERKQLNKKEVEALANILTLPAVDDNIKAMCFQPRNAVVVFHGKHMSCFDFCFDCNGFAVYGDFRSDLIMNSEKYHKLKAFYKKHKFKYELD